MTHHQIKQHILDFLNEHGESSINDIFDSMPGVNESTIRYHVGQLKNRDKKIEMPKNGVYRPVFTSTQTQFNQRRKQFSKQLRSAEDNEVTISELLNKYDDLFKEWVADNGIAFETRLERFKWLTAIADKLMKRWALVHVGYDTNSRQAQEDAKAKTEAKQKAALKESPVEDQVTVLGSFDLETKQLIDNFPTLENLSEEDEEKITV